MKKNIVPVMCTIITLLVLSLTSAQTQQPHKPAEILRFDMEYSKASICPAKYTDQNGIAVQFQGSDGIHYYANHRPRGYDFNVTELKITASSSQVSFADPVFPVPAKHHDTMYETDIDIYSGDFDVFIPFKDIPQAKTLNIKVTISGQGCTDTGCTPPQNNTIKYSFNLADAKWKTITDKMQETKTEPAPAENKPEKTAVQTKQDQEPYYSIAKYFFWAILAGFSINLMPCVLPVIPIIIMRLVEHSKSSPRERIKQGMAFCAGIILFFAAFAAAAGIIKLTTGAVIDLNSMFRYTQVSIGLFLVIVLFGLVMLDIIPIVLPSAVAGKSGSGSGIAGSAGTGFFAAVLSIPCSGALLGFVLVWAQTQTLLISSLAIICMGIGMALPYAFIISIPGLLERLPKPGTWMELFKKSCGFILFFIGIKLGLAGLTKEHLLNVLMYGVIFSFCVWMWGKWVDFSTPGRKKIMIRLTALTIGVLCAVWLLPAPKKTDLNWQEYNQAAIDKAVSNNQIVLLKFTADWCTNCKVLEKRIFHDPKVIKALLDHKVMTVKADTTTDGMPALTALKQVYKEAGNVPVTILLRPGHDPEKIRGSYKASKLLNLLD